MDEIVSFTEITQFVVHNMTEIFIFSVRISTACRIKKSSACSLAYSFTSK